MSYLMGGYTAPTTSVADRRFNHMGPSIAPLKLPHSVDTPDLPAQVPSSPPELGVQERILWCAACMGCRVSPQRVWSVNRCPISVDGCTRFNILIHERHKCVDGRAIG